MKTKIVGHQNLVDLEKAVQLEASPCPLGCKGIDEELLIGHDKLLSLPGEFKIVKCSECGLIRTNPRPTPESIGFYYPDDYGPYIDTEIRDRKLEKTTTFRDILRRLNRQIFDTKESALPQVEPGTLLEIGCASGSFLHHMAQEGWHVEGIEFSKEAALKARQRGYAIHTGTLEDAPMPTNSFDLLVGWMVLEHLHDPVGGLRNLHKMAKPNAWLVLSVPNAASLEFQLFASNWYALHLPNHLYHFTPNTVSKILSISGWEIVKVHHQRNLNNLILSIAYEFEERGWSAAGRWMRSIVSSSHVYFYLSFPLAWLFSIFGQTGRMTIWAKPNSEEPTYPSSHPTRTP